MRSHPTALEIMSKIHKDNRNAQLRNNHLQLAALAYQIAQHEQSAASQIRKQVEEFWHKPAYGKAPRVKPNDCIKMVMENCLLNSFKSEAMDNAHDSTYDPQEMTVVSMFAGDDENQWLDQVEEEFSSDLLDNKVNEVAGTKTTIKIRIDAKASLANDMKEKDYDITGVDSRSSKRTHQTNMTRKMGCTSARSVTTKKSAMNFKQQKTYLNAKRKKNAQLEQTALRDGSCFGCWIHT